MVKGPKKVILSKLTEKEILNIFLLLKKNNVIKKWTYTALRNNEGGNKAAEKLINDSLNGQSKITVEQLIRRATGIKNWSIWLVDLGINQNKMNNKINEKQILDILVLLKKSKVIKDWSFSSLLKNEDKNIAAVGIINEYLGYKSTITVRVLVSRAKKIKPWFAWAADLGIDGVKIKFQASEKEILNTFILLKESKVISKWNSNSLRENEGNNKAAEKIINKSLKESSNITVKQLINKALRIKDWPLWLTDIGFNPTKISNQTTEKQIFEILVLLKKSNTIDKWNISSLLKNEDKNLAATKIIDKYLGHGSKLAISTLISRALKIKPWSEWASELELDLNKITEKQIFDALVLLKKSNTISKWNFNSLIENESNNKAAKKIINDFLKEAPKLTIKQLVYKATRIKNWSAWLVDLGFDLNKIENKTTEKQIFDILILLKNSNTIKKWNLKSLLKNESNNIAATNIIDEYLGYNSMISIEKLVSRAKAIKPWSDWLVDLGFDLNRINNKTTEKELLDILFLLKKSNTINKWNLTSIIKNDRHNVAAKKIIDDYLGYDSNTFVSTLISRALQIKPWPIWLSDLGFDLTQVQLSGKIPYELVNEVTRSSIREIEGRKEHMDTGTASEFDNSTQSYNIVGADRESPEAILGQEEFSDSFANFTEDLSIKQKEQLDILISAIEDGRELPDLLVDGYETENGVRLTPAQVKKLLNEIKASPELAQLFSD